MPSLAQAQAVGRPQGVAVSVERIGAVGTATVRTTGSSTRPKFTEDYWGLFGYGGLGYSYSNPRIAIDYVTEGGWSAGLAYGHLQTETNILGEKLKGSSTLLNARLGYYYGLGRSYGIWGRLGATHRWLDVPGARDFRHIAVSAEVSLLHIIGKSVADNISVFLDAGVTGGRGNITQKVTDIGIATTIQFL